jgi:hypothetical protein
MWTQLSTTERLFYLIELISVCISVYDSYKLRKAHRDGAIVVKRTQTLQLPPTSYEMFPLGSAVGLLFPNVGVSEPLFELVKKLLLTMLPDADHADRPAPSKLGLYFCGFISIAVHAMLYMKWRDENQEETLCNLEDLMSDQLLEREPYRLR